jgi:hypothetical protein
MGDRPTAAQALHPNLPSALPEERAGGRSTSLASAMYPGLTKPSASPTDDPFERHMRAFGFVRVGERR